jgi:endoplasmic reticulum resident protein 44
MFKSMREELVFAGDRANEEDLFNWAREHCNPIVREITFENGEELTEEGLPFLIMFYDPDHHEKVRARF